MEKDFEQIDGTPLKVSTTPIRISSLFTDSCLLHIADIIAR